MGWIGAALWRTWRIRGHLEGGRALLQQLLETGDGLPRSVSGPTTIADARASRAITTLCSGAPNPVSAHPAPADEHSHRYAIMILGAATETADHHQGTQLLQEALATARSSNDAWLEIKP